MNPKALVQLSGGIDSTYVLYDWLVNNPKDTILVHHIHLRNHEGRLEYERKAVIDILEYLRNNGHRNFIYLQSGFDYGTLGYIIKDVEICGFFLGIILRNKKWESVNTILMPIYKPEAGTRHARAQKIRHIVCSKKVQIAYPLINMTKKEVINALPKGLLELTWYCRKPKEGKKCGECITCKEVNQWI